MTISIHQPDYIPYWGYFYKMLKSEVFVYLDNCQFSNNSWHNCNRIKTSQGEFRLKIPVKQHLGDKIDRVQSRDELNWKERHLKTLEMNYKRSKHFDSVFPDIQKIIMKEYKNLAEMNIEINGYICKGLNLDTSIYRSSDIKVNSLNEQRIIDICKELGATEYYSGIGARAYESEEHFKANGIKLTFTDYRSITYPQLWGEFVPNLSIIDYLFNCGFCMPNFN